MRDYVFADWAGSVPCRDLYGHEGEVTVEVSDGDVLLTIPASGDETDPMVALGRSEAVELLERLTAAVARTVARPPA